jgi:hypothetical protein
LQVCKFASLQVCKFASLQVCKFASHLPAILILPLLPGNEFPGYYTKRVNEDQKFNSVMAVGAGLVPARSGATTRVRPYMTDLFCEHS